MVPPGFNSTCYRGSQLVNTNHQMCDVTNPGFMKLLQAGGLSKAQIAVTCSKPEAHCDFQLWLDSIESFFCEMKECKWPGMDLKN